MISEISPKIAENIIKTLEAGIVPKKGIQYLLVGRNDEVHEIISILDRVSEGESDIRFWVGDFGSGKSFILRTIESLALQKKFEEVSGRNIRVINQEDASILGGLLIRIGNRWIDGSVRGQLRTLGDRLMNSAQKQMEVEG